MKRQGLLDKRKASCEETKKSNGEEELELITIPEKFLQVEESIWKNQIMVTIRINTDMTTMRK